jgi:Outer membrane protein beta-barrel domain
MDEDLHNIEDLFYSALNDNEETPSTNVWDGVERQLDKDKIVSIKRKYLQLKRIAAILFAFLIMAIFAIYNISNHSYLNRNSNARVVYDKTSSLPGNSIVSKNNNSEKKNSLHVDEAVRLGQHKQAANNSIVKKQDFKPSVSPQNYLSGQKNNSSTSSSLSNSSKLTSSFGKPLKDSHVTDQKESRILSSEYEEANFRSSLLLNKIQNSFSEMAMNAVKDSIANKLLLTPQVALSAKKNIGKNGNGRQALKNKKLVSSRLSLTVFFSPDVAWYLLEDENANNQSGNANEIERDERHGFSSDYGILLNYRLNKNWSVESGLSISNTNINSEPEVIYASPDNAGAIKYRVNTSSGYGFILPSFSSSPAIGDSLYVVTLTHSLHYLSVPVAVSYDVLKGKYLISLKAGLSVNFLTSSKLTTSVENGTNESVETVNNILGVKKTYLNGLAGISVSYQLFARLSLVVAPTIHFALNSINKNTSVKSFPMYFGPAVGLRMRL